MLRAASTDEADDDSVSPESPAPGAMSPAASTVEGTLRAPRMWERLLVDAAVIGGRDRWEKRLAGLRSELVADRN